MSEARPGYFQKPIAKKKCPEPNPKRLSLQAPVTDSGDSMKAMTKTNKMKISGSKRRRMRVRACRAINRYIH